MEVKIFTAQTLGQFSRVVQGVLASDHAAAVAEKDAEIQRLKDTIAANAPILAQAAKSVEDAQGTIEGLREMVKRMREALENLLERAKRKSASAYCDYIAQMQRPACLGWEQKVREGRFGDFELSSHTLAGNMHGQHLAYASMAKEIDSALTDPAPKQSTEGAQS